MFEDEMHCNSTSASINSKLFLSFIYPTSSNNGEERDDDARVRIERKS
jgi:hypothetical protein